MLNYKMSTLNLTWRYGHDEFIKPTGTSVDFSAHDLLLLLPTSTTTDDDFDSWRFMFIGYFGRTRSKKALICDVENIDVANVE